MHEKLNKILTNEIVGIVAIVLLGIAVWGGVRVWRIEGEKSGITIDTSRVATTTPSTETPPPLEATVIKSVPIQGRVVASKKGKVYHLPTCPGAKRILPENERWFASAEEAKAAGLTPAANCKGLK